ncbi:MAG TPA: SurA N-terminal domain-containing protein [Usitatibacter sp.]|nr:SurA N-terminal domain-containing protein [Usitatibacter sp.]
MLEHIRTFAQYRIVRWTFVAFLILVFGLFGVEAYLQRPGGGDVVATVGPTRIGAVEFDNALRQQADTYRQQFRGNFDPSIMANPEIRRSVLDRLVNDKLVAIGSERAGVKIPDKALAERIATEPFFQVEGKFSKDRYEQLAKSQNLTAVGLDERLRQDYRQQQFRDALVNTAFVPRSTLDGFIRLSEQSREVSVVNLGPEAYLSQVKVTPEQVKSYYDGHAAEFAIPERARVEYVELSLDSLAARAEVPPEELKKAYDEGMERSQWGQPEERRASHILIATKAEDKEPALKAAEAKARAILEQVRKNPKSFADLAKKESQDPGSGAQGGDLGFFQPKVMVKPFADAVFAAKKGEIVGPVKSDFGYHVILVTDIKPAKVKSFADATPELEAGLKKQIAARKFAESAEAFSNTVYEQPTSLKPAADILKVPVQQSGWVAKGQATVPLLGNPKLQAEIFSDDAIKAKRNTSAVEVAPSVLVAARVIEHKPAESKPLETVRVEIERKLQREAALKLARADGEAKLKALQSGSADAVKFPPVLAVNRQKSGGLPPQVLDKAFRADAKKLPSYAGVDTPAGYALVKVAKVIELEKVEDSQRQALGAQLRQAVSIAELEATLANIRNRVGVTVRKDVLDKKSAN